MDRRRICRWLEREGMLDRRILFQVLALFACLLWPGSRLPAQTSAGATAAASATTATPAKKTPAAKKSPAKPAGDHAKPAGSKSKAAAATDRKTTPAATRLSATKLSHRRVPSRPTARSIKLTSAFHASEQLR